MLDYKEAIFPVIIILLSAIVYYFLSKREKKEGYSSIVPIKTSDTLFTSSNSQFLSTGTVKKVTLSDKGFNYLFVYNLPNSSSPTQTMDLTKKFNHSIKVQKYNVFMSLDKDSNDKMEFAGLLERQGDGNHILSVNSLKDYKRACIVLGSEIVQCMNIN